MIKIQDLKYFPKILGYNLYSKIGVPFQKPIFMTINVNDYCNSRCKTCGIWKNDPKKSKKIELRIKEYEKIFTGYGNLFWITFTGGEPFLRNDLSDLILTVEKKTKPRFITITTNGWNYRKIKKNISKISNYIDTKMVINLSLDGFEKSHDFIRGRKGSYKNCIKTFYSLKEMDKKNLIIGINTVISKFNIDEMKEYVPFVFEKLKPDSFIFENAEPRYKLKNKENAKEFSINKQKIKSLTKLMITYQKRYSKNDETMIIRKLREKYYQNLTKPIKQTNFEGLSSIYLLHNGEISLSDSIQNKIGNIRDFNYSFDTLLKSEQAKICRQKMLKTRTTLANAFYVNYITNIKNAIKFSLFDLYF